MTSQYRRQVVKSTSDDVQLRINQQSASRFDSFAVSHIPHTFCFKLQCISQSYPVHWAAMLAPGKDSQQGGPTWPRPAPHSRSPIKETWVEEAGSCMSGNMARMGVWLLGKLQVLADFEIFLRFSFLTSSLPSCSHFCSFPSLPLTCSKSHLIICYPLWPARGSYVPRVPY